MRNRTPKAEQETVISWTQAEFEAGYFSFYTTRREHYQRLLKRIGGERHLLSCQITSTTKGAFAGAQCHVPARYLSEGNFSIRPDSTIQRLEVHHLKRRPRKEEPKTAVG